MKHITKLKLEATHQLCDAQDKSTEFMYQFMQEVCDVNLETVNAYFLKENHKKLFKEVNEFNDLIISLNMKTHEKENKTKPCSIQNVTKRYLFLFESEGKDGWTFEIEAEDSNDAYDKAYDTHGPQVAGMMYQVI